MQKWYRIEDKRYANYDPWAEYDQPTGSHTAIEVLEFALVKRTPKGVWLTQYYGQGNGFGDKRFVLDSATRRFADSTIELAFKSFIARKRKQANIYIARAARAEEAMYLAVTAVSRVSPHSERDLLKHIRGPSVMLTSALDDISFYTPP